MDSLIIFSAKYLIVFLVAIALIFFLKQSREKQKEIFIFALIALPITYVVAKIGSWLYFNPRPFAVGNFTPLIAHAADNGFPSDHTLLSAAVASVIYFYDRKVAVILFLLAVIIGGARVLAGVHHVADIAGSIAIAFLVSFLVHKFVLPKISSYKK